MAHSRKTFALLGATALGLAFATPSTAQTSEENACDVLTQMIEEAGDNIGPDFADATQVAETSDGNACLLYVDRVEKAGGITAIAPKDGGTATIEQNQQAGQAGESGIQSEDQSVSPAQREAGPQSAASEDTAQQNSTGAGTAEQATAQQEPASEETAQQEPTAEEQQSEATAEPTEETAAKTGAEVIVADITGRDVVTADGEEVGEIDRIVVINDEPYVIFKRGGFFGLGSDDVAVPAAQIEIRGEELVLTGIDSEEFEAMAEFEADTESELAAEDTVRIGSSE